MWMRVKDVPLRSRKQSAEDIYNVSRKFWSDLLPFQEWTLRQFYEYIHSIPFVSDDVYDDGNTHFELVPRPAYLLDRDMFPFLDCKKKTTLFAAFAEMQGWDWILIGSSETYGVDPHHIFLLIWDGDNWLPVDANLPEDYLFKSKFDIVESEIF